MAKMNINRRKLLSWGGMLCAALLGGPYLIQRWSKKPETVLSPFPEESLFPHAFKSFSVYEAAVLHELTGLIIPRDHHPGAKDAMIVVELDQLAQTDKRLRHLCQLGVQWLDGKARDLTSMSGFLELSTQAQIQILQLADFQHASFLEKVYEQFQYGESQIGYKFFTLLKNKTFSLFYTHPLGWLTVGYHGPPQGSGNLDYNICG